MKNKYILAILCSVGLLCFASYSWATPPLDPLGLIGGSSQSDKDKSQPVSKPESEKTESEKTESEKTESEKTESEKTESEKTESEKTDSQKPDDERHLPQHLPPLPELQPDKHSPDGMLVVLIGINDYTEDTICDLSGAEDVRLALTDWLVPYSKTHNRVTVWVASDKVNDLAQKHSNLIQKCMLPTKANIVQLLKETENANYNRLIVYFSGHGVRTNNTSYLVPQDATKKDISSFISLKDDVFTQLNKSKIKNKLLVLDASRNHVDISNSEHKTQTRSVATSESNNSNDFMSEFETMVKNSKDYSFNVITSCSKGEQAQELQHGDTRNSLFSWYFIKGLAGEADMTAHYDGKTRLVEAYNYARSKTYKHSVNSEYLNTQTPEFFCYTMTQFIISSSGRECNWVNETENETPWHFLYRIAVNLAKENDPVQQRNAYGNLASSHFASSVKAIRILTGMLEINPSDLSCYSIRSRIYRKKGLYRLALQDISKTNGTLDVYSKLDQSKYDKTYQPLNYCTLYSSASAEKIAKTFDKVLPISLDAYYDGYYKVVAIDGIQAEKEYWISEKSISWDPKTAESVILGHKGERIEKPQLQKNIGVSIDPPPPWPLRDPIDVSM